MMSRENGSNFQTKKARRLALVPKFAHRGGLQVTANEFYSKKIINILKKLSKVKKSLISKSPSASGLDGKYQLSGAIISETVHGAP